MFRNGRIRAVRLPSDYRFEGSEVYVRRDPATGILKKSRVTKPPVPVERIAEDHGLDVRLAPFDGDLSGALIRNEDEAYIGVNSSHHPHRQRFTIAHELAHYFLHSGFRVHIDKDF
ncbi:MAG: hypothetical protein DMG49_23375 [Acidobacteria bacterium]|nr:MAG: hypothetical protein DMG49_23375 [Acidobacteriota bacterium]